MAVMLDLPPELLELVFHSLGCVDDVHHLGRACKKTYNVIQRQKIYVEITRSIIRKSPQHRYDLQLCQMLGLHRKIVQRMQQDNSQLPTTQSGQFGTTFNEWENAIALATTQKACENPYCSDCLPDGMVYEILARYQGLRILENMWLARQLTKSDYISADKDIGSGELTDAFKSLMQRNEEHEDGNLPSRSPGTPESAHYTTLDADQRARFYSAVTFVWLLNEIRWTFTNFAFPTRFNVQVLLLGICKKNIDDKGTVPVLGELDRHAVFKFMYHHLFPLYGSCLQDRDIEKLPFTYASNADKDPLHTARLLQLFLTAGQTYFQPPDLIDLVIRSKTSRRYPYPIVALPASTEHWHRPSQAFAFPENTNATLHDTRYKSLIQRASLTHLNVIARSSFHQHRFAISPTINAPAANGLYVFKDLASYHFLDRALVAFELHENPDKTLRNIREVFSGIWENELWSVWWWGNCEDKVRARLERWRRLEKRSA